jgi:hypothetical protein
MHPMTKVKKAWRENASIGEENDTNSDASQVGIEEGEGSGTKSDDSAND